MPEIGAYEAKTHLPKLLARVQSGQRRAVCHHPSRNARSGTGSCLTAIQWQLWIKK